MFLVIIFIIHIIIPTEINKAPLVWKTCKPGKGPCPSSDCPGNEALDYNYNTYIIMNTFLFQLSMI